MRYTKRIFVLMFSLFLIATLASFSYAMFIKDEVEGNIVNGIRMETKTADEISNIVKIIFDNDNYLINTGKIKATGYNEIFKFKITTLTAIEKHITIDFSNVSSSLNADSSLYSIYECNEENYNNATYGSVGSSCTLKRSGFLPADRNKTLILSETYDAIETNFYVLKISISNNTNNYFQSTISVSNYDEFYNTYQTKMASYASSTMLGYKLLTNPNTIKYNKNPILTKSAVSQEQYNIAPTDIADYKSKVCNTSSSFYSDYHCATCTTGNSSYNESSCNQYYLVNTQDYLTTEENGIFYALDDNGTTFFYRGVTYDNYVKFAGFTWRIVRINGDGSIRIILSETTSAIKKEGTNTFAGNCNVRYHSAAAAGIPNEANKANAQLLAGYADGELETAINTFYVSYINTFSLKLADSTFCNDVSLVTNHIDGQNWVFNTANRFIYTGPSYLCNADYRYTTANSKLSYPIATLSSDEIVYAGVRWLTINQDSYLKLLSKNNWWTMSPTIWYSYTYVGATAIWPSNFIENRTSTEKHCVRPVINLKADTIVTGTGTSIDPYNVQ